MTVEKRKAILTIVRRCRKANQFNLLQFIKNKKLTKMDPSDATKCRICLESTDDEQMFDLFEDQKDSDFKLSEKIEICCGVRVRQSTEMPSQICLKCFDITRMCLNFRHMCLNSQIYLESLCTDRKRPKEFDHENYDESAYLDYLQQELQITTFDLKHENMEDDLTDVILYEEDENYEPQYEDEYLEEINNEDSEYVEILRNVKTDTEDKDCEGSEIDVLAMEVEEESDAGKSVSGNKQRMRQPKCNSTIIAKQQKKIKAIPKRMLRDPSPTSFMCSICGNVYSKKSAFTYHMSLHSNVKPHECEICGKAFRQVSELRNHMRRHTGEKPYKCSYCDRHFIDRSEKHRHERVHINCRPYTCNVCGKSFTYSTTLKNHSKLHSGEKDFNCLVCDKSFSLQHQLKAHLQTLTHKQKETHFVTAGYEVVYE